MKNYQYFFLMTAVYVAPHADRTSCFFVGTLFAMAAIITMIRGE